MYYIEGYEIKKGQEIHSLKFLMGEKYHRRESDKNFFFLSNLKIYLFYPIKSKC